MQKFIVNIGIAIALLAFSFSRESPLVILSAFLIGIALSTLYGDQRFNFLYILLVFPFVSYGIFPSYILYSIVVSSVISYYFKEFSYVLLPLGLDLLTFNISYLVDAFIFLGLIIVYAYLKYDSRGIIASGIILLVFSAFLDSIRVQLGNIAYFDLVFGVISTLIQSSSLRIPRKVYVPVALALYPLLTFALPLPSSYYWWNPSSFLYKDFLYLYIIGYGYNLRLDQAGLYFISSMLIDKFGQILGLHILIFLLYYISGLSAYLFFEKNKLLLSFVYSLLTPIQLPEIAITYSLFPLALVIASKLDWKRYLAFSVITFLSTLVFPFAFTITSVFLKKRREYIIFSFFLSLFWLIPYALIHFPNYSLYFPQIVIYVLLVVAGVFSFFANRNYLSIGVILGLIYVALQLPYSFILYPFLIIGLLSVERKYVLPVLLITLIVAEGLVLAPTLTFSGIPKNVSNVVTTLEKDGFGLVYWKGSYSLLSPYPITNSTAFAKYEVSSKFIVTLNPEFETQPYPIILKVNESIIEPPKVINFTNSIVEVRNNSIYWKIPTPMSNSEIEIFLHVPEKIGYLDLNNNLTNLEFFYVVVYTTSGVKEYKQTSVIPIHATVEYIDLYYYATKPLIINLTPIINESGKFIPMLKKLIPFEYKEYQRGSNSFLVYLKANDVINVTTIKGYEFSINSSKFVTYSILKPGYYEIYVKPTISVKYNVGIYLSVIFFFIFLIYVIFKEKLVRVYEKLIIKIHSSTGHS
ncbi:hypothetical protein SJAV_01260 [Sulfurisphaera javensis]|uniref:Uncharacterized protein n=1 Tax=Sulfurisphaera javensis TaxID=2049879 RepID=A0AAT9GMT2_9CREN